jgi:hypothetical protein
VQGFIEGDKDLVEGYGDLPADAQEKLDFALEHGHVPDEDWKGVSDCPCRLQNQSAPPVGLSPRSRGRIELLMPHRLQNSWDFLTSHKLITSIPLILQPTCYPTTVDMDFLLT